MIIEIAGDIIVKLGIIISSPFLISITFKAISKAADPLDTDEQYFLPISFLKLSSNFLTSGPAEDIQFFLGHLILFFCQMLKV